MTTMTQSISRALNSILIAALFFKVLAGKPAEDVRGMILSFAVLLLYILIYIITYYFLVTFGKFVEKAPAPVVPLSGTIEVASSSTDQARPPQPKQLLPNRPPRMPHPTPRQRSPKSSRTSLPFTIPTCRTMRNRQLQRINHPAPPQDHPSPHPRPRRMCTTPAATPRKRTGKTTSPASSISRAKHAASRSHFPSRLKNTST
jgi:hypothetical protein